MRGHDPGVKPWLAWVWRLPGHELLKVGAWPRSVHEDRKAVPTRRVGEKPLDPWRLARAVDAHMVFAGAVWAVRWASGQQCLTLVILSAVGRATAPLHSPTRRS